MTTRSTVATKPVRKPAAPTTSTVKEKGKDAIALLKEDHRRVEELFSQFESAGKPANKEALVQRICEELTVHATLEESQFYPPVREALANDQDLIDEAEVEHASLKWLIAQLESASPQSDHYEAKVTVLKEYVQHHVKEEEKTLFPKVRKSALDTVALGKVLQATKTKLQQELKH
jgi:hemerythrin superfamily protein